MTSKQSPAEALAAKKAAAAKRKQALLAKMKKKQTNFIQEPKTATKASSDNAMTEPGVEKSAFDDSEMVD